MVDRGHRRVAHTADLIVEAWGPELGPCLAEVVTGLVGSFADTTGAAVTARVPVKIPPAGPPEELVVSLCEEVLYLLDAKELVPVSADLRADQDRGLEGELAMTSADDIEVIGAVPKAIARSDLRLDVDEAGQWWCRVTVDV